MTNATAIALQRLMNDVQDQSGAGKLAEINGHQVRCIGVHQNNTNKLSFRFDLDGRRASFSKVVSALDAKH